MKKMLRLRSLAVILMAISISIPVSSGAQALKTPLSQEILTMLTNEISGQIAYNNIIKLAGAPWIRDKDEFTDTFYESKTIHEIAKSYGVENSVLERYPANGNFEYPFEGEFWVDGTLTARLSADAALIARSSQTADISGELIYVAPFDADHAEEMITKGNDPKYNGKIALMWSHPRGSIAAALDAAGLLGVISFSTHDRYLDPNQVIYSRGAYGNLLNLKLGFSVSWRQWSELLEDVEKGIKHNVRCKADVQYFPNKFETVFSWIPGTEPDKKGVIFTAHLFEGYIKRGTNDNMSGCVVQLEILRALNKLIKSGELPQPRRTIYFVWPNEISGTYEHFRQHPGFAEKLSVNINMDMVGEGLRINNSVFTMSECPNHLPSYLDGLAKSIMNYVWRTNDIVYLPDSPRGRSSQNFPIPMMEKNGSTDAFRFFIHAATGGSDHICFNNASVAVPGIEFFTWPDQWYHTDKDLPDKSDPTELKRVAFIGAACAWAAANCTDEVLDGLLDVASEFGYMRIAEREHVQALSLIENAEAGNLQESYNKALNLLDFAVGREIGVLNSISEIYTGSEYAKSKVKDRAAQWEFYRSSLAGQLKNYAEHKAVRLNAKKPKKPSLTSNEKKYAKIFPAIHPDIKGREFSLTSYRGYREFVQANPERIAGLELPRRVTSSILNFVNGKRSITEIKNYTLAQTGINVPVESVAAYLEALKEIGWVEF